MRNKFLILLFVVSSLFFIDNVKAFDMTYDYDNADLVDYVTKHKDIIDNMISTAEENNDLGFTYLISLKKYNNKYTLQFSIDTETADFLSYTPVYSSSYGYWYDTYLSFDNATYKNLGVEFSWGGGRRFEIDLDNYTDDELQTFYNNIIKYLNKWNDRYGSSLYDGSQVGYYAKSDYFTNDNYSVLLYCNIDKIVFNRHENAESTDNLIIGGEKYSYGTQIPTYYQYHKDDKSHNKFDGTIEDINYAFAYAKLNLEQLKANDYNINFNYAYGNLTNTILKDAYLEIDYVDGTSGYISVTDGPPLLNVYMGEFEICIANEKEIQEVKVIFPMQDTDNVVYKIQAESNVDFVMILIENGALDDYYEKIDLTGKYSAIFIPKTINENEIFTDFYMVGDFELRGISNIDNLENALVTASSFGVYNHFYRYVTDFRNSTIAIQFVNTDYKDNPKETHTISFDSRYFTYVILDDVDSVVSVVNPNTGNNNTFSGNDIEVRFLSEVEKSDLSALYENLADNYNESSNAFLLVNMSISKFFETCPKNVKSYILVYLFFAFSACLIFSLGWK